MVKAVYALMTDFAATFGLLWAGVALGGNMIAAPAKFQVAELPLSLALQVGRAQFGWLGYAEWILLLTLAVLCILVRQLPLLFYTIPILVFLIQQWIVMPLLNTRSDLIITGSTLPESNIHIVFNLLELTKITSLIAVSFSLISRAAQAFGNV